MRLEMKSIPSHSQS